MHARRGFLSPVTSDERDLINKVRAGDISAFETIFKDYTPRLCDFAFGILRSHEDAQDVVQESFLKIWKNRADLTIRGTLADYLYVAVRNAARNRIAHRQVEQRWRDRTIAEEDGIDDSNHLDNDEQAAAIARALAELPEKQRGVCTLRWTYGLKYSEIAQRLGISEKTVENHLNRALKDIREKLAE